jgi:hypothetical protein
MKSDFSLLVEILEEDMMATKHRSGHRCKKDSKLFKKVKRNFPDLGWSINISPLHGLTLYIHKRNFQGINARETPIPWQK